MARRKVYLEDIPLDEAYRRFWQALERVGGARPRPGEAVPVAEALGRVTAAPVWARLSVPHYHAAAMDGAAIRAADTVGASETAPIRLRLGEQATWVDTGDPLPPGADAVVMLEHLQQVGEAEIELMQPVAPWQHVRPIGEDIVATELVLPEGRRLGPVDLGAIAASGSISVVVRQQPRVAILPTGTELVSPGAELKPGDIVEFNSIVLGAQVQEWGGVPTRVPPTPDDFELIKRRVARALETHDVVAINAGSSAGSEDFTASVVQELGELVLHGVAIRPGHPLVLGVCQGKAVLGIPGYPVSAVLTSELFLRPLLHRLLGLPVPERPRLEATMTRKVLSPMGEDEFMRVKLGQVGERVIATPLQRGAGVIMSLVRADGIVRLPRFSEGVHAGASVSVELLRRPEEVRQTIVAIGSHDLTLDLLSSAIAQRRPGLSLSSSNVGSLGGLIALQRGECHLAGSHLLDEATGEYNLSYVRRLLPGRRVVLVNLVYRAQGLIVPPGNPKGITSLDDLLRDDVYFINRQKGAGTRVLLDYKLKQMGHDPARVRGYEREEFTHLGVAAAVAGGAADVGLGILAAARALKLDFVPLLQERYDLVIPLEHYQGELLAPLLEIIRGPSFPQQVEALGGYDVSAMGRIISEP
ncbi:MAG: molybdopterin biosynthesis protein [Chloroflexi bacterium]|nr:molybdopterin biosynthesis protein [Chloroflexota bacterium]